VEGREAGVVRRLPRKAISRVEKESILHDVYLQAPAAGDQKGSQGHWLDKRKGIGEAGSISSSVFASKPSSGGTCAAVVHDMPRVANRTKSGVSSNLKYESRFHTSSRFHVFQMWRK
jgi:uncharacterized FAD-dependent dehydrogenase